MLNLKTTKLTNGYQGKSSNQQNASFKALNAKQLSKINVAVGKEELPPSLKAVNKLYDSYIGLTSRVKTMMPSLYRDENAYNKAKVGTEAALNSAEAQLEQTAKALKII